MLTKLLPKLLTKFLLRLEYTGGYLFGARRGASIARWAGALCADRHSSTIAEKIAP